MHLFTTWLEYKFHENKNCSSSYFKDLEQSPEKVVYTELGMEKKSLCHVCNLWGVGMKLWPLLELEVPSAGAKKCECTLSLQRRHDGPWANGRKKGIVMLNPGGVFFSMKGQAQGYTFPWRKGTWFVHSFPFFFLSHKYVLCVRTLPSGWPIVNMTEQGRLNPRASHYL